MVQQQELEQQAFTVPPQFQLCLSSGPSQGTTFTPKGYNISVGRTKTSKLHIRDPSVSERHAEICWNGNSWLVRDLGSSNGTRLNGTCLQPFETRELTNGSELSFGSESAGKVQLVPMDLRSCTVEQMLQCQVEVLAQSIEAEAHREAAAMLKEWGAASAELQSAKNTNQAQQAVLVGAQDICE